MEQVTQQFSVSQRIHYEFQTQYNRHRTTEESNALPSMTIPNQTMSMTEMLTRHAQGLPMDGVKIPVYEGDEEIIPANWNTMDLSERMDYKRQVDERIELMKQQIQDKKEQEIQEKLKQIEARRTQPPAGEDEQTDKPQPSPSKNDNNDK